MPDLGNFMTNELSRTFQGKDPNGGQGSNRDFSKQGSTGDKVVETNARRNAEREKSTALQRR